MAKDKLEQARRVNARVNTTDYGYTADFYPTESNYYYEQSRNRIAKKYYKEHGKRKTWNAREKQEREIDELTKKHVESRQQRVQKAIVSAASDEYKKGNFDKGNEIYAQNRPVHSPDSILDDSERKAIVDMDNKSKAHAKENAESVGGYVKKMMEMNGGKFFGDKSSSNDSVRSNKVDAQRVKSSKNARITTADVKRQSGFIAG